MPALPSPAVSFAGALPPASVLLAPALRRPLLCVLVAHALLAALLLRVSPPAPAPTPTALSVRMLAAPTPQQQPTPAPRPVRAPTRQPRASAPALISTPAASSTSQIAVPPAPTLAPEAAVPASSSRATAAEPAPLSAPRFDADYLNNPAPAYPPLSRKLGETGRVVLRVLVGADGRATQVELQTSSGFARLDQAALQAVRRWTFVPAHQGTQAVSASVLVPIVFSLRD